MKGPPAPGLRELIHPHTGDLREVRPAARGFQSDCLAVVEGAKGSFFVKAMENKPGWRRNLIVCEGAISPFVRSVSPSLLWQAESADWIALGFEVADGRPAEFGVDSGDLPAVVDLVQRVGALGLPGVASRWHEKRWDRYANDAAEAELFRGDALLHVDLNPDNVIVGEQRAWLVDWANCSRGAAFIDPAVLVLQLVASGHTPGSAESWAAQCQAWRDARPEAVDAFAAATARMYQAHARHQPDETWLKAMVAASEAWAAHRGVVVG